MKSYHYKIRHWPFDATFPCFPCKMITGRKSKKLMSVAMHSAQKGMTVEGKPTCVFAGNKQKVPSVGSPKELSG